MKPLSWQEVREGLAQQGVTRPARNAGDFWSDFKARARLTVQEDVALNEVRRIPWFRLAYATAAVVVVAAIGLLLLPTQGLPVGNRIKSLEVIASHSGVIIMNDNKAGGTILWISDLKANEGG